jgi:hypothetical protein
MDGTGKGGGDEEGYEELYEDVVDIGGENGECTEGMYEGGVVGWAGD